MRSIIFILCLLPFLAFGQGTTIVKEIEKEVSVDVSQDDNGRRDVKVTSSTNGDEKVFEWKDNGTIPEDVKAQLISEGIDINILDGAEKIINEDVEIHIDRKEMTSPKNVVIKMIEDEGDTQVLEWNGDGEMPKEMQVLLEEHDINIEEMGDDSQIKKSQIKMIKKERKEKLKKVKAQGRSINDSQKKKYRIVTIDDEENKEVNEWEGDGEEDLKLHKEGDHTMMWISDKGEDENLFVMKGGRKRSSDAYMGAHISSSEEGGALVEEIAENGPASNSELKKGDLIKKVNGARVKSMDDLLDLLSFYEPNDEIEFTISRNGKEEKITIELGKRPKASRL